jgi:hypothetical protein
MNAFCDRDSWLGVAAESTLPSLRRHTAPVLPTVEHRTRKFVCRIQNSEEKNKEVRAFPRSSGKRLIHSVFYIRDSYCRSHGNVEGCWADFIYSVLFTKCIKWKLNTEVVSILLFLGAGGGGRGHFHRHNYWTNFDSMLHGGVNYDWYGFLNLYLCVFFRFINLRFL